VLRLDVEPIAVVEVAVPRLRDHGHRKRLEEKLVLHLPPDDRIPHHADAVRVGILPPCWFFLRIAAD